MIRGEIWTAAFRGSYSGKPRPVVILQDDRFTTDSVTVCPLTTDPSAAPMFRLAVTPGGPTGLTGASSLMVDKITTIPRTKVGERLGRLGDEDIVRLGRAVVVFLGLAG